MHQKVTDLEPQPVDFEGEPPEQTKNESRPGASLGAARRQASIDAFRGRPWRFQMAVLVGALFVLLGLWWLYQQFTHVFVNDARISATMVAVSSRVPGWVKSVSVIEGDHLKKGQLLVQVDDRESRLLLRELDAQLEGLAGRRDELEARISLTDNRTQSQITAAKATVRAAEAELAAQKARSDLAKRENQRNERLAASGTITRARLDETRAALETARQQVLSAEAKLENARASLNQAEATRDVLIVLEHQLAELDPEEDRLRAQRERAQLDLSDRTIVMPFDGVVDQVFVDIGEYIMPGQRLLLVHDPSQVWVEANVKETDIRFFRPEKSVDIKVDALPGRRFEGTVTRVGQATTSEFALLPNPNPSGNFTKISQRLPVRIQIQQEDGLLKPGMMVELEVRASE